MVPQLRLNTKTGAQVRISDLRQRGPLPASSAASILSWCIIATRSVFERYAIVSQSDIADALRKLEASQQQSYPK
jgi:hypothetical protein